MRLPSLALVIGVIACGHGPTATVAAGSLAQRIVARAVIEPSAGTARVRSARFARITAISVHEGQAVKEGEELARLVGVDDVEAAPITAPIAGTVVLEDATRGDAVTPMDVLFEIADTTATQARFELEEEDASRIDVGAHARVTTPDGRTTLLEGTVTRLSPRMQQRSIGGADLKGGRLVRTGWVSIPGGLLLARQVEVVIDVPPRQAKGVLPRDAVFVKDGRSVVHVAGSLVDEDVEVRIGAADDELVEVEGIPPGTRVRRGGS